MPLMHWDETMSVGNDLLDDQHKQLIELINQTFEAIQRLDRQSLPRLLDLMQEYALTHFRDEEAAMRRAGFAELDDHMEQHAVFHRQIEEFQRNLQDISDMPEVFVFLSRWLTNHILVEDKKLLPHTARPE